MSLGLLTAPVGLGLDGAAVAEGRVETVGVEPALDPADQVAAGVGSGGPAALVGELAFEGPEERLGRGVVLTHPGRAHRLDDPELLAQLGELGGGVLTGCRRRSG